MPGSLSLSVAKANDNKKRNVVYFEDLTENGEDFKKIITTKIWSPIVWNLGYRVGINFLRTNLFVLDFDTGEWTINDATDWANETNIPWLLGLTKSHQKAKDGKPPCDRFRLILKAETCTSAHDYAYTMRLLMQDIPCDPSAKDAARYFFPCTKIHSGGNVGSNARIRWISEPEEDRILRQQRILQVNHKDLINPTMWPFWVKAALTNGARIGERHYWAFRVGCYFALSEWAEEKLVEKLMRTSIGGIGEHELKRCIENATRAKEYEYEQARYGLKNQ